MVLAAALLAAGCRQGPPRAPAIGEAYVGPATLKLRSDIPMQSSSTASVKRGERVEILQRRRRYLRVRTRWGAEGWTDETKLLASDDMADLQKLAERAAKMPSQGQGISYSELNVHTQPARNAPSFLQVKEKEKVDVLTHLAVPRTDIPRKPLIPPQPKKSKAAKKPPKPPKYPPPPMPKPPPVPTNWVELSKSTLPEDDTPDEEVEDAPPTPTDDWSLIRTSTGQAGWVLTRRVIMAIPDEVAQYAEGRRIVSYFSLGKVDDDGVKKDVWLWTTVTSGPHPFDFESFRVFIWSLRRHRYETAHIERNLQGYSPVLLELEEVSPDGKARATAAPSKFPGFSVCVDNKDGQKVRRQYALFGNVIRYAGERPCELPPPFDLAKPAAPLQTAAESPEPPKEGLLQRLKDHLHGLLKKK